MTTTALPAVPELPEKMRRLVELSDADPLNCFVSFGVRTVVLVDRNSFARLAEAEWPLSFSVMAALLRESTRPRVLH